MKKKFLRNASLVALSAVLVGSSAVALAACGPGSTTGLGGNDNYTITVNIFCGAADEDTNERICNNWAEEYSAAHAEELGGNKIKVDFQPNNDSGKYFETLQSQIGTGNYADIIYLSPKNVISYAASGHVLDIASYVEADATLVEQLESIWPKSLAFYATTGTGRNRQNASSIEFDGTHFVDSASGEQASLYGLPKDYSNFALGYNKNYFTDEMKAAYTTLKASDARNVTSRLWSSGALVTDGAVTHTGASSGAITYATDGSYTNPYTQEEVTFKAGDEAPFVVVGVPISYKPFNYYKYETYDDALLAGDPMAVSVETFTGGDGYTIVIPGFPGETFTISEDTPNAYNADAEYDAGTGHIVLTWTEYGALSWACTYMLNSFAWSEKNPDTGLVRVKEHDATYTQWKSGEGGVYTTAGYYNVYGGEQFEHVSGGAEGPNLYVNPWLYSNDASYIDQTNTKSLNESRGNTAIASSTGNTWSWTDAVNPNDLSSYIGNAYEELEKTNLDGTTRMSHNQYGMNSENFVEAYGAFHEHNATWNAHVGQTGDVVTAASDKDFNGQAAFVAGASLFYGVGTWDISEYQEVRTDTLDVGITPTAVSNRLALYVETRDTYYTNDTKKVYSNGATKQTGDGVNNEYTQRTNVSEGLKQYTMDEIYANQLLRQDKWGARMDSVGYAVNAHVADEGQPSWKAAACVSLVLALTVDENAQVTLTYGGAQIPNVMSQCNDYLNYNVEGYEEGAFVDMITPEGDAEGNDVWDGYYALAIEMASAGYVNKSPQTVREFLNGRKVTDAEGVEHEVKYDEQYADVKLVDFTTATSSKTMLAYAMRVLRMINYTRTERDLSIRMQYMNSARQQSLYTVGTNWMTCLAAQALSNFLAYRNQAALTDGLDDLTTSVAKSMADWDGGNYTLMTPALYCVRTVLTSQNYLSNNQ